MTGDSQLERTLPDTNEVIEKTRHIPRRSGQLNSYLDEFSADKSGHEFHLGRTEEEKETQRKLLEYFLDNVVDGEADTKVFSFESFKQMCDSYEQDHPVETESVIDPLYIRLQRGLMTKLPHDEVDKLIRITPKGLRVTVYQVKYLDGSSPTEHKFWKEAVGKYGLYKADQTPFPSEQGVATDLSSLKPIPKTEHQKVIDSMYPQSSNGEFVSSIDGYIMAEPMQGYAGGGGHLRIMEADTDKEEVIVVGDIVGFEVTGVDFDLAKRRDREIYPGRRIQVWDKDGEKWVAAKITENKRLTDVLFIQYEEPQKRKDFFGNDIEINHEELHVGKSADYSDIELPELGTSSFEQRPWLYQDIDMTGEATRNPYEQIPDPFRSGRFIRFPDGKLGLVERASEQGMSYVAGIDSYYGATIQWALMPDNAMPQVLSPEGISAEIKRDFEDLHLKDKVIKMGKDKPTYIRIKGVFQIGGVDQIVLEELPVRLGKKANMTRDRFMALPYGEFQRLSKDGFYEIPKVGPLDELKSAFPNETKEILENLNDKGEVLCNVDLKDGRTARGGFVVFHSLPWGVWIVPDGTYIPELVSISNIKSLSEFRRETEF